MTTNATAIDVSRTIVAKSDQLNADDLMSGPVTVQVTDVRLTNEDQPIAIHISGGHQPWKPCKTMRRLLVAAWGSDGAAWKGRWLTLFRDPAVKFGGDQVGGIRVSHMSDIPKPLLVSLAVTKGKKAPHRVEVLPPPSSEMPFAEFRQHLGAALKAGWPKEAIDALLGGPASDIAAEARRDIVATLRNGPPASQDPVSDHNTEE